MLALLHYVWPGERLLLYYGVSMPGNPQPVAAGTSMILAAPASVRICLGSAGSAK